MKPGSKQYIRFMRKTIFYSRIAVISSIPVIIFEWQNGRHEIGELSDLSRSIITPAIVILALIEFLLAFAPVPEVPNWKNVYPELNEKPDSKKK